MSTPTTQLTADDAAVNVLKFVNACRADCARIIASCDAGSLNLRNFFATMMNRLGQGSPNLVTHRATPGFAAAMRRKHDGNWASDAIVNSEYAAIQAVVDSVLADVLSAFAANYTSAGGWLELERPVAGVVQERALTAAPALATIRGMMVTLRDSFDV